MSIIESAKLELKAANFGEDDSRVMVEILEKFFATWDSGGAVAVASQVLMRLIAGQPLGPLTGEDDEWFDHGGGVLQNKRMGSVFKDPRFHEGKLAYDIDAPEPRAAITFPYSPPSRLPQMPVYEVA